MAPVPEPGAHSAPSFGSRTERGFALALALFAIVIIGALVAANFFSGWLEWQAGHGIVYASQAREAAEAGLDEALSGAPAPTPETLPVGGAPLDLAPLLLESGVSAERQISRLTPELYLLRSTGIKRNAEGTALAVWTGGLLVRSTGPAAPSDSGVTVPRLVPLLERAWAPLF